MKNDANRNTNRRKRTYQRPAVTQWRGDFVRFFLLGLAAVFVICDAHISYQGFVELGLPDQLPLLFTAFVFVTQLAVGILHGLGEDFTNIRAGSDTEFMNTAWKWGLAFIYGVDIVSNAIHMDALSGLSYQSIVAEPVQVFGTAALQTGFAVLLAFGDEIMFRVYDVVEYALKKNGIFARRYSMAVEAHNKYIASSKERQFEQADAAGRREGDFEFGEGL